MDVSAFYREYRDSVFEHLLYLFGNHDLAETATQDGFLQALEMDRTELEQVQHPKAWLLEVGRNIAKNICRDNSFPHISYDKPIESNSGDLIPFELPSDECSPDILTEQQIFTVLVENRIKHLPTQQKLAIRLWRKDQTLDEIADQMNIGVPSIQTHVGRAHETLWKKLSDKGIDSPDDLLCAGVLCDGCINWRLYCRSKN